MTTRFTSASGKLYKPEETYMVLTLCSYRIIIIIIVIIIYMNIFLWYQVFLYNANNLHTVIWFQVFLPNINNLYTIIYGANYSYMICVTYREGHQRPVWTSQPSSTLSHSTMTMSILFSLYRNNWYHIIIVYKSLVLDRNTWNHMILRNFFSQILT